MPSFNSPIPPKKSNPYPLPPTAEILHSARLANLPAQWNEALAQACAQIRQSPELAERYSLACSLLINEDSGYNAKQFRYWEDPVRHMGNCAPIFFLLLSLACIKPVCALHARKGIPADVTRDTCASIGSKALDYAFFHNGSPGTQKWALWWFQHHIAGRLYRVGRLEYILKPLSEGLELQYKSGQHKSGQYKSGQSTSKHRKSKQPNSAGAVRLAYIDPETKKASELYYPQLKAVQPNGTIQPLTAPPPISPPASSTSPATAETPNTPSEHWQTILKAGDPVLEVHIPGGGALSPEKVAQSFARALAFYQSLAPPVRIQGFETFSWIFSPDLEALYPPGSNLIQFRDSLYTYPAENSPDSLLPFVFGGYSQNPADWPENTSVQRNLKKYLQENNTFPIAGMLIPCYNAIT